MDEQKVQIRVDRDEWQRFDQAVKIASGDSDPPLTRSSEIRRMIRDYNTRVLTGEIVG